MNSPTMRRSGIQALMAIRAQVPDGWREVRLEEVADVNPRRPTLSVPVEMPTTFVPMASVGENCRGVIAYQTRPYREVAKGYTYFESNDVLFAKITPCLQNGKHVLVNSLKNGFGFGTTEFHIVRAGRELDPKHLYRSLTQPQNILRCISSFTGTAGQQRVQPDVLRSLRMHLPPLAEQRAIAAVLDAIDEAIERTEAVISATERMRDALLHELLTRGVPGWHTEWRTVPGLGTVPADWEVVPLKEVLTLDQPGAWGDEPTPNDHGVRVLRAADLTRDGRVDPERAAWRRLSERDLERRLMQDGDIILERSGGGPGTPVGRVALIDGLGPVYCSNFCQHLRVDTARCKPNYAVRALWRRYLRGVTARLEHRTTGIRNLDYAGYLAFPLPLPSLAEQDTIAKALDSADGVLVQKREERDSMQTLKASATEALLTGCLRLLMEGRSVASR